jgi:hypothetical protein
MYRPAAVSEQALANAAMDSLRPGSMVRRDRNFGVFTVPWEAQKPGLEVVIRLIQERAEKLNRKPRVLVRDGRLSRGEAAALYRKRWKISITILLNVVKARWPKLQAATDPAHYRAEVFELRDAAAQGSAPS